MWQALGQLLTLVKGLRQKAKARKTQRKGKCSLIRWICLIRISCSSIPRVSQEVRMALSGIESDLSE